ncbi:Bestrophin-1 [Armadillidium vulgare]|nr:Bestrophin-1 [Armadillidium vulgare]
MRICKYEILHAIALYVSGNDDKGRILRRSLVRYLNLSLVMVLRSISSAVKKRFPTVEHLVEAVLYQG